MEKTYKLIGLAKRAGRIASGETSVKTSILEGSAFLVLLADDISKNTYKNITNSCKYYDVDYYTLGNMERLGRSIGNNFNAAIAVLDEGLANLIVNSIKNNDGGVA